MEEKQSSWPSCAGLLGTSYWKRTPPPPFDLGTLMCTHGMQCTAVALMAT